MVTLAVVDEALSSDPTVDYAPALASQLVESAMTDLREIERLDKKILPLGRPFDRQKVALVREMYNDWAEQTCSLLERISRLEMKAGLTVTGAEDLRDSVGRTRAMLSISLDAMEESERELAEDKVVSLEEVRRELRARSH